MPAYVDLFEELPETTNDGAKKRETLYKVLQGYRASVPYNLLTFASSYCLMGNGLQEVLAIKQSLKSNSLGMDVHKRFPEAF